MTTARALRGPFDYRLPEELREGAVDVGSMLVVPFGRREVLGVVVGLAEHQRGRRRRSCSRRCARSSWACRPRWSRWPNGSPRSTARRSPARSAWCCRRARRAASEWAQTPRGRAPRASARWARAARRRRCRTPNSAVLALLHGPCASAADTRGCCTASPARARPRSTCAPPRRPSRRTAARSCSFPRSRSTPQIVGRFIERFGETVAVMHSQLRPGERYAEWRRLREGDARICVGPRSAVFAPIERLGLIVVDEEHDASYKHEGDPRYDARDVAAERARRSGAVLLLGSATPRAGERPARRLARRSPGASTGARCRAWRSSTCATTDRRPANRPASEDRAGARARCAASGQGDRAAQPPRLVELPLLPLLRARVGLPGMRCRARPASRRRLRGLPSLRPSRAGAAALRGLLLDVRRASRRGHRAPCSTNSRPCSTATAAFPIFRLDADVVSAGAGHAQPPRRRTGEGAAAPLRGGRLWRADRHADGRQGARLPGRRAWRGARRRRDAALPGLPCRGADVRADRPARRPRRARRGGARAGPDDRAGRAGHRTCRASRQQWLFGGRAAATRGAQLSAVLAADQGGLLGRARPPRRAPRRLPCAPASPRTCARVRPARPRPLRCSGPPRCFACVVASARCLVIKAERRRAAVRRDRRGGARRLQRPRAPRRELQRRRRSAVAPSTRFSDAAPGMLRAMPNVGNRGVRRMRTTGRIRVIVVLLSLAFGLVLAGADSADAVVAKIGGHGYGVTPINEATDRT